MTVATTAPTYQWGVLYVEEYRDNDGGASVKALAVAGTLDKAVEWANAYVAKRFPSVTARLDAVCDTEHQLSLVVKAGGHYDVSIVVAPFASI